MPQLDLYHDAVKHALVKDGWTITHDPFALKYKSLRVFVDLGAEKIFADEKGTRKVAIEIKVFENPSPVNDFEKAMGQYEL